MSVKDNKLPVDCPACGVRFSISVPEPEIVNQLKVSMIVAVHETPASCPQCNQKFGLGILPAGKIAWGAMALSDEDAAKADTPRIIQPGLALVKGVQ